MRNAKLKVSVVLLIGLFFLLLTPKSVQNALRSSFLKPVIPLGHLLPFRDKKNATLSKTHQAVKPNLALASPNATIGEVIYRHPGTWNDFFWINVGKRDNQDQPKILRYSPILFEGRLIGVVDYVGEKQSRVQLITNADCTVSVRSARGQLQYEPVHEAIHLLQTHPRLEKEKGLQEALSAAQEKLFREPSTTYLAKGEIYGRGEPLWRSNATYLKGQGFQCEYEDPLSAERDLLTGRRPEDRIGVEIPLIEKGDLLITTGFDGIFPPGIEVAQVLEVEDLIEGAYAYDITALPLTPQLKDLNFVEVILPQDYISIHPGLPAFED